MLKIEIDVHRIIPVRLIPLVTGWRLPTDDLARMLANKDSFYHVHLDSYQLDDDGSYHLVHPKKFETCLVDIESLSREMKVSEVINGEIYQTWFDDATYQVWLEKSIMRLPAKTFVRFDDLENAWDTVCSENRYNQPNGRHGNPELNLLPLIPTNVAEFVYQGFESLLVRKSSSSNNSHTLMVRFGELHHYMMLDPYYGVNSQSTLTILENIYRENTGNPFFQKFRQKYSQLPCKTDIQRHLIYLWCGLLGLPVYRDNQPLGWQHEDFLTHWTGDFELQLDDLQVFLRQHSLPLPTIYYPDQFDNTERKLALDEKQYEATWQDITVILPQLVDDLAELKSIQAETMEERRHKKEEITRIELRISEIKGHAQTTPTTHDQTPETENRFILTGDHWSITYQCQTKTYKNTKGLRYILWLIKNQGKEVPVSDLYYAVNPPDRVTMDSTHSAMTEDQLREMGLSVGGLGDAGDVLTPEGKNHLKQHISQIQEQIEDAIERGDEELQQSLEEKLEKLIDYVSTETGLGGRTRKASSSIEKIRTSVTKSIRRDIKNKIIPTHPELGQHLDTYLKTGTWCIYNPIPPIDWAYDDN